jgi:hypothetical protein
MLRWLDAGEGAQEPVGLFLVRGNGGEEVPLATRRAGEGGETFGGPPAPFSMIVVRPTAGVGSAPH